MPPSLENETSKTNPTEPRWLVVITMLAAGVAYFALPERMSVGPRWLLPLIISILLVPAVLSYHWRRTTVNEVLGHALSGVLGGRTT